MENGKRPNISIELRFLAEVHRSTQMFDIFHENAAPQFGYLLKHDTFSNAQADNSEMTMHQLETPFDAQSLAAVCG